MYFVMMDEEGRDLLDIAAAMSSAAIEVRVSRFDEDDILKRAHNMSKIKLDSVINQLYEPPLAKWSEIPDGEKKRFVEVVEAFANAGDDIERRALFEAIRSFAIMRASKKTSKKGNTNKIPPRLQRV